MHTSAALEGALAEVLLQHRPLIEQTLHPLAEDTPDTILALRGQEPAFWELRVVEYIRDVLVTHLAKRVRSGISSEGSTGNQCEDAAAVHAHTTAKVVKSEEFKQALQQVYGDVQTEIARFKLVLNGSNAMFKENYALLRQPKDSHFLEKFWATLQASIVAKEPRPEEGQEESGEMAVFDSCSFDAVTFDEDLNDACRSASSFPCMEDIPAAILRMQSPVGADHSVGLDEIGRMPIVEILHCGPSFSSVCAAIVGLFLDSDDFNGSEGGDNGTAARAKRLVYELVNQAEDPSQFLELYWTIVDFVGARLASGELFVGREHLGESNNLRVTVIVDCFRVLLALLSRVPRHWIYFSPEALARVLHSAFRLLVMYSTSETEIDANHAKPLTMLALVDNQHLTWFKLWLFKVPNQTQLFAALDESGLVHDLLQYLSRVRPLAEKMNPVPAVDAAEKRAIQCALSILSWVCEYDQGRELLSRWKRVSAHSQMMQRHTEWVNYGLLPLESTADENDRVFHFVKPVISEEEARDELEANYEHLGSGVVDALVLSISAVIVTTSGHEPRDLKWAQQAAESMATYLHIASIDVSIALLLETIRVCWKDYQAKDYPTSTPDAMQERETLDPWLPFRQSKSSTGLRELFGDCVAARVRRGKLSCTQVQECGHLLLAAILSNKTLMKAVVAMPETTIARAVCDLSRSVLSMEILDPVPLKRVKIFQERVFKALRSMARSPKTVTLMHQYGVIEKLIELHASRGTDDCDTNLSGLCARTLDAVGHSATGLRFIAERGLAHIDSQTLDQWQAGAVVDFREISGTLALLEPSEAFFGSDEVQAMVSRAVAELQQSSDFTMALNSSEDECAAELYNPMRKLLLIQCCLSTQHASNIVATGAKARGPLVQFIADVLGNHNQTCCSSSCAEDTCCVAFQLALALTSSLPAMLTCAHLFSELQLLDLDEKSEPRCEWLSTNGDCIGSCTLLEQQLRFDFSFIGGPSEKLQRCDLYEFDKHSTEKSSTSSPEGLNRAKDTDHEHISGFAGTLQEKILQSIAESTNTKTTEPMDFVLVSQASWELISELETPPTTAQCNTSPKATVAFTKAFGILMQRWVTSGRSRLEPTAENAGVRADTVGSSLQDPNAFFPTDSERKLMNRLYKSYAQRLSLGASPTVFHCIVKQFGRLAMNAFPVTVLMMLHPRYDEEEIIDFLARCLASPLAGFLWPSSAVHLSHTTSDERLQSATVPPGFVIAEAVERILECEYPQILHVVDQCHCSVLTLVLKWHGQSFWNYFDWENIVVYIYLSMLYGAEFQVYCIVAILKHLEPRMREIVGQHNTQSLTPFLVLTREPIANFRFSSWRLLLLRLRSEYHDETAKTLFGPR